MVKKENGKQGLELVVKKGGFGKNSKIIEIKSKAEDVFNEFKNKWGFAIALGEVMLIDNKPYLKKQGKRRLAQMQGVKSEDTDIVTADYEKGSFVFKATVITAKDQKFTAHGMCSKKEKGKERMTIKDLLHTAETRALNRAIDNAYSLPNTFEEMPNEERVKGVEFDPEDLEGTDKRSKQMERKYANAQDAIFTSEEPPDKWSDLCIFFCKQNGLTKPSKFIKMEKQCKVDFKKEITDMGLQYKLNTYALDWLKDQINPPDPKDVNGLKEKTKDDNEHYDGKDLGLNKGDIPK